MLQSKFSVTWTTAQSSASQLWLITVGERTLLQLKLALILEVATLSVLLKAILNGTDLSELFLGKGTVTPQNKETTAPLPVLIKER